MADSGNHNLRIDSEPGTEYALSGKIMLTAIVVLFAVVVFLAGLHIYARWYAVRLRRLQIERRRTHRRVSRSQIVTYIDSRLPAGPPDRGLGREVLSSLPVFLHAAPELDQPPPECAVCISEFEEGEIGRVLPKCGHSFHIECIDMWFRSHSTCPLCRSPVEQVVRRPAEPGSSSGAADLLAARKGLVGVRIEVPARSVQPENDSVQGSPASRIVSRILSMGRRSPASTPSGTGEIDLESGPS